MGKLKFIIFSILFFICKTQADPESTENYKIHKDVKSFNLDPGSDVDDITKDQNLIVFDKSRSRHLLRPNSDSEYQGPQRYEISQTERNESSKISAHEQRKKAMFDPESNRVPEDETDIPERIMDNFDETYRRMNETLSVDNKKEIEDKKHPYPPLPRRREGSSSFNDESPPPLDAFEEENESTPYYRETYSPTPISRDDENLYSPVTRQYSNTPLSSGNESPSLSNSFKQETDDTSEYESYSTSSATSTSKDETYSSLSQPSTKTFSLHNDSPPSTVAFKQENEIIQDSTESYSITSVAKDERTTQSTTLENSSDSQNEYDSENLGKSEEVDYSEYDQGEQTYTRGSRPFAVTKSLMNSMSGDSMKKSTTTFPKFEDSNDRSSSQIQDSEATIYPTLFQPTQSPNEYEDYEVVTSDYVSNMDPAERDTMFPRDYLKPWERKRGERITTEGAKPERPFMEFVHSKIKKVKDATNIVENSSQFGRNEYMTDFNNPENFDLLPTTTPYYTEKMIPAASSIYGAQPPPLSSFVMVPSGQKYYGDQTPQVVSDSAFNRGKANFEEKKGEQKIDRENTVEIQNSDYKNQPQYSLYAYKTAIHRAHGVSTGKPFVENYDHWLANPATIFDLPMPIVLKTAFAVNSKVFGEKVKAFSDKSNLKKDKFELDSTKNQLKYKKVRPDALKAESFEELSDLDTVSGGSSNSENFEIQSYVDEEELNKASQTFCGLFDLKNIPESMESHEVLNECFVVAENCLLINTSPIERRINNLTECAEFCGNYSECKSFSYSKVMNICDIFALRNGTTHSRLIRYNGYSYFQPTEKNITKCLQERKLHGSSTLTSASPINVNNNELTPSEKNHLEALAATTKTNPNFNANPCPENSDVLIIKADGYRIRNFGIGGFTQNSSEGECIFSCIIDIANGIFPYSCTSASYNLRKKECHLYSAGSNIRGNGHLLENGDFAHYEKVCADADLVDQCKGYPIERIPQKVLLGFVIQARTAGSLLECVTYCYQRFKRKNDCLSISYYYTEATHNCVLNSESHLTAEPYFLDEVEVVTDYASLDRCLDIQDRNAEPDPLETEQEPGLAAPDSTPLAIDNEDGSRVLFSNPGFDYNSVSSHEVDIFHDPKDFNSDPESYISRNTVVDREVKFSPKSYLNRKSKLDQKANSDQESNSNQEPGPDQNIIPEQVPNTNQQLDVNQSSSTTQVPNLDQQPSSNQQFNPVQAPNINQQPSFNQEVKSGQESGFYPKLSFNQQPSFSIDFAPVQVSNSNQQPRFNQGLSFNFEPNTGQTAKFTPKPRPNPTPYPNQGSNLSPAFIVSNNDYLENEIRRAPVKRIEGPLPAALPVSPNFVPLDSPRTRLKNQLHRSIKKIQQ